MGKKLKRSELIALLKEKAGFTDELDDIIDDETGKGYGEFKTGLTAKEKEVAEHAANLGKWTDWWKQVAESPMGPQIISMLKGEKPAQSAAAASAQPVTTGDPALDEAIWNDSLYKPLHPHFQHLTGGYQKFGEALKALVTDYAQAKTSMTKVVQEIYEDMLERRFPDFKENKEAIRKYAQERNIADWGPAIEGWRGTKLPDEVKKAEQIAREAALKEKDTQREAARVEMGGGGGAGVPAGSGDKKEYSQGWQNLETELKTLGL